MKKAQEIPTYLELIEQVVEKALKDAGADKGHLLNLKRNIRLYKKDNQVKPQLILA